MTTFLSCQRTKSADTGLFECKKIVFVRAENVLLIIVQIFIIYYVHHQKNIFQIRDEESFHKVCMIIFEDKFQKQRIFMATPKLSNEALAKIINGEAFSDPILQILGHKQIEGSSQERYFLENFVMDFCKFFHHGRTSRC